MALAQQTVPTFIDIGVNLTNSRFDKDRESVITNAQDAGVISQIITGTTAKESQEAFELTQAYSNLYATAGCHPHDTKQMSATDFELITRLLEESKVVAVGECGLDFNRNFSPPETQIKVFEQQVELACHLQKPLFLHERDASDTMLSILDKYSARLPKAVIHCFTGSEESLKTYLELGLYIGITGWICDERRGQELTEIVPQIPDNQLMIETDSPYLIPRDLRPKPKSNRNLPQYLPHIAKKLAELRNQPLQELAHNVTQNTIDFFQLDLLRI